MRLLKRFQRLDVLFFAIPFIAGIVYLLAFFPGILTFDSISQWDQASQFAISDWHPAYHTILIWLLTRISYSPAVIVAFQVIVFSGVVAYGLRAFKDLGVSTPLLILLDGFVSLIPINGMMEITLWKDVLYSIFVLLQTIYLLKIIASKGAWLRRGWNWLWLGLAAANVSLLRHNGFPVAFGTLVIILLVFSQRKAVVMSFVASLLFIGIITSPVYKLMKVNLSGSQSLGVSLVHPIAAYVHAGATFSPEETAYLNRIYPLENGWTYNCYEATALFYTGVNFQPVQEDPLFAARLLARLTLSSPGVVVKHFTCMSSFVWQLSQPVGVSLESLITKSQSLAPYPRWQKYAPDLKLSTKLPYVRKLVIVAINWYSKFDIRLIALRPAIYLYLFTAASLFYAFRTKSPSNLLLLVPAFLQSLAIAFFGQAQALRYQYPVYLISMLFVAPLIYLAIKARQVSAPLPDRAILPDS